MRADREVGYEGILCPDHVPVSDLDPARERFLPSRSATQGADPSDREPRAAEDGLPVDGAAAAAVRRTRLKRFPAKWTRFAAENAANCRAVTDRWRARHLRSEPRANRRWPIPPPAPTALRRLGISRRRQQP